MVSLIFTIAVLAKTISKSTFKKLPIKIRATLLLNLLQLCASFGLMLYVLLNDVDELQEITKEWYTRLLYSVAGLLWIAINWQFTSYYMQTACLLRISLRVRINDDISLVQKRRKRLLKLEYSIYGVIFVLFILCCIASTQCQRHIYTYIFN